LKPDLIFLDIALPKLNGIEAARQIRTVSPNSKVLFSTQESDLDIVREALNTGALGYIIKANLIDEILDATAAVTSGQRFLSDGIRL
jgi:DNA-binding NarL/FixJ family response regulator